MTVTPSVEWETLTEVEKHAFSVTDQEVGGILVGELTDDAVRVTASIPALRARGNQMHVTFTHEVWADVLTTIDRDFPGQQIVGWYHTHPGFGLFLSEYDKFIHENFFSDPRMVALVIDPLAGRLGWFTWVGDALELSDEGPTARPAVRQRAGGVANHATVASRRTAVVAAVAAFTLVGGVCGYLLGEVEHRDESTLHERQLASVSAQLEAARQDQRARSQTVPASPRPAASEPSAERAAVPGSVEYRVRSGDSLWALADSFYGNGREWRRIMRSNVGTSGNRLVTGQVLRIPTKPD